MRASSVFVALIVLDAFLLFGMMSYAELTGSSPPHLLGDSAFLHWVDYNETAGVINYTGEGFNETSVENATAWSAQSGIVISGSNNDVNFATLAWDFITLMINLVTAPFTFVNITGLGIATRGMAYLFSVGFLCLQILALWQIIVGRTT